MSQPDCLFCRLVAGGDHVHAADGFVAIRDIAPKAPVHLLVLPERHLDTFRDIGELPDEEAARMLRFVADAARVAGLEDYRVVVNVGPGGGQEPQLGRHVAPLSGLDHVQQEVSRPFVAAHRVVLPVVVDLADAGGGFLAGVAVQVADRLLGGLGVQKRLLAVDPPIQRG